MNEPTDWMAVLQRIEESLALSLAKTPEIPPAAPASAPPPALANLDERFGKWRACLERAERAAGAAEGELEADERVVSEWLAATASARKRLDVASRRA